jgi:hypothetical protein
MIKFQMIPGFYAGRRDEHYIPPVNSGDLGQTSDPDSSLAIGQFSNLGFFQIAMD